jgi:hypothetical protein
MTIRLVVQPDCHLRYAAECTPIIRQQQKAAYHQFEMQAEIVLPFLETGVM